MFYSGPIAKEIVETVQSAVNPVRNTHVFFDICCVDMQLCLYDSWDEMDLSSCMYLGDGPCWFHGNF